MATLILTVRISPVLLLAIACFTRWRNSYLDLGQILAVGSPIRRSRLNLKWRPRVSVRGLMIAVLVLGSVLGLIFHRARVQREAVRAIKDAGGTVRCQWERTGSILIPGDADRTVLRGDTGHFRFACIRWKARRRVACTEDGGNEPADGLPDSGHGLAP